jgi:hypothetical protein
MCYWHSALLDFLKGKILLGVVVYTCNSSTWKAEAGGSQVQGQPGLHSTGSSNSALNSNPSLAKREREGEREKVWKD